MRAILAYHSIDSSGSVISIDKKTFRGHVEWLATSGIKVVGLEQLAALPPHENAIALTFDDGFENFAHSAWPLLRAHGLPATLFVVTDCAGASNHWESWHGLAVPRLRLLDWPALAGLAEQGVTLGSHTRTHPQLRSIRGRALIDEVEGAAERLRAVTGSRPAAFAYPFGVYDMEAVGVVRAVHSVACTTEFRTLRVNEDPLRLPRLDAYYFRSPGRLESWGSKAFRRYLWLRSGGRRIRQVLRTGRIRA